MTTQETANAAATAATADVTPADGVEGAEAELDPKKDRMKLSEFKTDALEFTYVIVHWQTSLLICWSEQ